VGSGAVELGGGALGGGAEHGGESLGAREGGFTFWLRRGSGVDSEWDAEERGFGGGARRNLREIRRLGVSPCLSLEPVCSTTL
jgi:hypothetical protein